MIEVMRALRFLSSVKPLKLKFAHRKVKLEKFHKLFKQLYLKISLMKEKLISQRPLSMNNRIFAPSNKATSTSRTEPSPSGSKSASLSNLVFKSLRRKEPLSSTEE